MIRRSLITQFTIPARLSKVALIGNTLFYFLFGAGRGRGKRRLRSPDNPSPCLEIARHKFVAEHHVEIPQIWGAKAGGVVPAGSGRIVQVISLRHIVVGPVTTCALRDHVEQLRGSSKLAYLAHQPLIDER